MSIGRSFRALLVGAGIVAASTSAYAQNVTSAKDDLDGDGKADTASITADGYLLLTSANGRQLSKLRLRSTVTRAQLEIGGSGLTRVVVATLEGEGSREGVVVQLRSGAAPKILWRGAVGPVGVDGEYRISVGAAATGAVRFQERDDLRRCDGVPARLFLEAWDSGSTSFRRIRNSVDLPANTQVLRAEPTERDIVSASYLATAATTSEVARDAGGLSLPVELDDGDPSTVWSEGTGSDGRGEFIRFMPRLDGANAVALAIRVGNPAARAASNRPARLALVGANAAYWVDLPDPKGTEPGTYFVRLPTPLSGCVSVVLGEVYLGAGARAGGGVTSIADLAILGEADLLPGGAMASVLSRVEAGERDAAAAARWLSRHPSAVSPLIARLAAIRDTATSLRLLRVLVAIGGVAAADALPEFLIRLDGEDLTAALASIAAANGPRALAQLIRVGTGGPKTSRAALAWLSRTGDESAAALYGLLVGVPLPPELEAQLAHALAAHPPRPLLAITDGADRAARWQALAEAGLRADAATRAEIVATMTTRQTASPKAPFAASAWLAQGVAQLGSDGELAALWTSLAALPQNAATLAITALAAAAVAKNPTAGSLDFLRRALASPDAGIRLAAVRSLAAWRDNLTGDNPATPAWKSPGDRAIVDGTDRLLGDLLGRDRWPELRSLVADALSTRCQNPGPAAQLNLLVDQDRSHKVRGDALSALARCRATGIGPRLIAVALDGKQPLSVRARAIDLIPVVGDVALEAPLVEAFARWSRVAFDDGKALVLAVRAANALGQLGGPKAPAVLTHGLENGALPELVAAAAAGLAALGKTCPPAAAQVLRELSSSGSPEIAGAARAALPRCGVASF